MSKWLDSSSNSNKLSQSYFKGFIDISGGSIYLRNDFSMNFYNTTDTANPRLSIKSDKMHIFDGVSNYIDVSNSKLIYLRNVSGDIQTQLNTLVNTTKYISSDASTGTTILELDSSGKQATVHGNLTVSGNVQFPPNSISRNSIVNGPADVYIGSREEITFDDDSFALFREGSVIGTVASDALFYGNITISEDASFNGDVVFNGNVRFNTFLPTSIHIPTTPNQFTTKTYVDSAITTYSENASSTFSTKSYVDTSINAMNNLLSGQITSANIALKTYTDTSINTLTNLISNTYATKASPSFTGTIISINDVSINSRLFVGQDSSFNGNVFVIGNIRVPTLPITTSSDLVATTAYVQNQGYVTQNTLFRQFN